MRGPMTVIGCLCIAVAATPATPQPTLSKSTTTILFDVVVRDRKGVPIRDMAATEFELSEDGARQAISAVFAPSGRALDPSTARSTPFDASAPSAVTLSQAATVTPVATAEESPSVVAFVFNQVTPEERAMAARVADAMLAGMPTRDWVGLFALEHRLHMAKDFTQDRTAARVALSALAQRPIVLKDASATHSTRIGVDLDPSVSPTVGAESAARRGRHRTAMD